MLGELTAVHGGFGPRDLGVRAREVNGGGASARWILPRDRCAQRPVHLEHAGAVAKALQSLAITGRQTIACDREQLARGDIEHVGARPGQLVEIGHVPVGLQLPAARAQASHERVGDGLRAAVRDGPAHVVRCDRQNERKSRGGRVLERQHGMRGNSREQCARALVV